MIVYPFAPRALHVSRGGLNLLCTLMRQSHIWPLQQFCTFLSPTFSCQKLSWHYLLSPIVSMWWHITSRICLICVFISWVWKNRFLNLLHNNEAYVNDKQLWPYEPLSPYSFCCSWCFIRVSSTFTLWKCSWSYLSRLIVHFILHK